MISSQYHLTLFFFNDTATTEIYTLSLHDALPISSSGGLIAEHKAVRGNVGVFDVSHMGDIRIRSGKKPGGALEAVQHITMNDASRLAIGQAQYSAMLYPEGTFVDDVIAHRLG